MPNLFHAFTAFAGFVGFSCHDSNCDTSRPIAQDNAVKIGELLDASLSGRTTDLNPPFGSYDKFRIDSVSTPNFPQGCDVTIPLGFSFVDSSGIASDQPGTATMGATFSYEESCDRNDICFRDVMVKELDFQTFPGETIEAFIKAYLNSQFNNPECFQAGKKMLCFIDWCFGTIR